MKRENKTELIHVRIEPEVKEQAEEIFKKLGINTSYAISIFLKQVILHNGFPFDVELPKEEKKEGKKLSKIMQTLIESGKVSDKNLKLLELFANGEIDFETLMLATMQSFMKNVEGGKYE